MSICIGVVGLIPPFIAKLYFDRVYPNHDVDLLQLLVIGSFALTTTTAVIGSLGNYYSTSVSEQLNRSMSLMFFNHLQHLPVRFFDEHRVGEITSRFGNVSASVRTVTRMFETVMLNGTFLILVPPLLLFMNPTLAVLSLITIPLTTAVATASSRLMRRLSQQGMEASADLSAFQVETLSHIRVVKGLAAEPSVFRSAQDQLYRSMDLSLKSGLLGLGVGVVNALLRAAGAAAFAYVAWTQILQQRLTLGEFTAFTMYMGYLTGPVGTVASLFTDFQASSVSFARMFEYLDLPVEQSPSNAFQPHKPIAHRLSGEIRFSGVSFGYVSEKRVLEDVSFHVQEGSLIAIVGASGAGKSSFLRLVCGMERADAGGIWFGETRLHDIALPDLRRQIAAVWQEVSLMRGSIRENLTYALEDISQDRIDEVLRISRLSEVVADLPEGLETPIAEWGATFSGGQRQRLAIARALLRDAPILMLDEATSNIDTNTESELLRGVFHYSRGRTVLFVTHRVATAALADKILVMDAGRVAGFGTHKELIEDNSVYRALHRTDTPTLDDPRRLRLVDSEKSAART